MQSAKFIDVTRTYLPINPNTFPISLHGAGKEDAPENKIPVMAYEGQNFLPTSYGYKSYFGTAGGLEIGLLTARIDYVFLFQNFAFVNILVALTDSGIWTKRGDTEGEWVNSVPMAVAEGLAHFEWTIAAINQTLYAYRQGGPSYQKIVSDLATGLVITSVVPNFLNMEGQVGIFRAGGRLGFWDAADSIGWSSLDDYADFTPSISTLAGSSKFSDVNGRIVTILPHGSGFMIYCTRSIIYINPDPSATFQWQPIVVLSTEGIAYPRQVVAAVPDTDHYAYTSSGLFKISKAKPEVIVPEVSDLLKHHSGPIYLSILEGRYLFLESLDPDFLTGLAHFSEGETGETEYVFPGVDLTIEEAVADELLLGTDMCATIGKVSNGDFATKPIPIPINADEGTFYKPVWKGYLSIGVPSPGDIEWGPAPCGAFDADGKSLDFNPLNVPSTAHMTTDSTHKKEILGSDLYMDGALTMERFVALQTAIWDKEDQERDDLIAKLTSGKAASHSKSVDSQLMEGTVPAEFSEVDCLIGSYSTAMSAPQFGFSQCSFWLTRYATAAIDLVTRTTTIKTQVYKDPIRAGTAGFIMDNSAFDTFSSSAMGAVMAHANYYHPEGVRNVTAREEVNGVISFGGYEFQPYDQGNWYGLGGNIIPAIRCIAPLGLNENRTGIANYCKSDINSEIVTNYAVANKALPLEDFGLRVESGYCEIIGFEYTNRDGSKGFVPAMACDAPSAYPPGGGIRAATPPRNDAVPNQDGTFCSIPFTPVIIPGTPAVEVVWPETSVTLPSTSFLMQRGSIAPLYPTMYGAFVYDLRLKKWGKYVGQYKQLLNYSPINNADNGIIPYSTFGIVGGIIDAAGKIRLFDSFPTDSYITYGKIGYYRLGNTAVEEVKVQFAEKAEGTLSVETSANGRSVNNSLKRSVDYKGVYAATLRAGNSGPWHSITVKGYYDISYIEFRGYQSGRR